MRYAGLAIVAVLAASSAAQSARPPRVGRTELAVFLNFEVQQASGAPLGWAGGPAGTLFADDKIVHGGKWSARLERDSEGSSNFSTITIGIPIDFAGRGIELRGFLKTEDVTGFTGLWMREDGDGRVAAFDNMQSRQVRAPAIGRSIRLPCR